MNRLKILVVYMIIQFIWTTNLVLSAYLEVIYAFEYGFHLIYSSLAISCFAFGNICMWHYCKGLNSDMDGVVKKGKDRIDES